MRANAHAATRAGRPGYVLIMVLLVVVILSLAAYRFAEAMGSEYEVAYRSTESAQARVFAVSGVHYAMAALADPDTMANTLGNSPYDNAAAFSNIPVGTDAKRGGGRFALVNVYDAGTGTGDGRYSTRYGVTDESGKININALIRLDPGGTVLSQVLNQLLLNIPNVPDGLADAITDWVDSDDDPRPSGAEADSYQAYRPRNGPLPSLDELLLVQGMTPDLLYGSDRNRNGRQDPDESADGGVTRGLADYLTVYGRELNVDSTGQPRTYLNDTDLKTLNTTLAGVIGQEMADYVVAYRLYTTGTASTSTSTTTASVSSGGAVTMTVRVGGATSSSNSSSRAGTAAELATAVKNSLGGTASSKRNVTNSILSLRGTQVTLPKGQVPPGQPNPDVIVACPLNNDETFKKMLPVLLDKTTAKSAYELNPRLNVTTAPADVLAAAGAVAGVTPDDINSALSARANLDPTSPEATTGAWLVTQGGMRPEIFVQMERLITGTTQTYRVESLGYFARGGPVARVEAVIDTNQGKPRILFFRELTDLGTGFTPPR